jgi:hypothetical protein
LVLDPSHVLPPSLSSPFRRLPHPLARLCEKEREKESARERGERERERERGERERKR